MNIFEKAEYLKKVFEKSHVVLDKIGVKEYSIVIERDLFISSDYYFEVYILVHSSSLNLSEDNKIRICESLNRISKRVKFRFISGSELNIKIKNKTTLISSEELNR